MAPQFCPECGTVVPVDDGVCHLGHPVPAGAGPGEAAAGADAPAHDEPTPWVATVEDDDLDPAAREPATDDAGVTGFTATSVEASRHPGAAGGDAAPAPEEAAVTDPTPPGPSEEDTSLEDLVAMAAASGDHGQEDETDLSRLQDDLSGDLSSDLGTDDAGTGASPDAYDLDATSGDDDFDLSALEEAVADLEGDAPAPPPGASQAPAPHDAPSSEQAFTASPRTPTGDGDTDEAAATAAGTSAPVSTQPARDDPLPADAPGLDPTNFTASGRKVSSSSGGSSSGGLLDKLKGLFSR